MLKTFTFALCHFSVAFGVAYLLTGNIGVSSLLAVVEPLVNTVAYHFHEKVWDRLRGIQQPAARPTLKLCGHAH